MKAREIELHIEELVLDGFAPGERWRIGDAVENELRDLLQTGGVPPVWLANPERIAVDAKNSSSGRNAARTGADIATAAYRGRAQ